MLVLGPTRPDRIELEKQLGRWAGVSWFLDDAEIAAAGRGRCRRSGGWARVRT
jgi:hypothetical protein